MNKHIKVGSLVAFKRISHANMGEYPSWTGVVLEKLLDKKSTPQAVVMWKASNIWVHDISDLRLVS